MVWLNVLGIASAFIGSVILATTVIRAKNTIDEMSATYWNSNKSLRNQLWKERNRALWGTLFLICGFLLQLISYCIQTWC
jgi:hypothetical protein